MKKYYKIFDNELQDYKEEFPVFESKQQAYAYYADTLKIDLNLSDNNDLKKLSDQTLFDLFDYEVHEFDYLDLSDLEKKEVDKNITCTVHFYENESAILSIYEELNGNPIEFSKRLKKLYDSYTIVNKKTEGYKHNNHASGISELCLFYVLDNNDKNGNMFAIHEEDATEADYDYKIYTDSESITSISVYEKGIQIFNKSYNDFLNNFYNLNFKGAI